MGKSHTVLQTMEEMDFQEDVDFTVIKGYVTPKALYRKLFENAEGIVIFDDTDSILKDDKSLNLLKGALDSYSKRVISWFSESFIEDGLPSSFEFKGQVIFISNLSLTKLNGALRTRAFAVDVSMTKVEKVERMETIVKDIRPDIADEIKLEVLSFIKKNVETADSLSMRTLLKLVNVRITFPDDWKNMSLYLMETE